MKISIPLNQSKKPTLHFGHASYFGIYEIKDGDIVKEEILTPPPHEPGVIPKWLSEQKVDIIISGGMGQRAQLFFNNFGIKVLTGAFTQENEKNPQELIKDFINNKLELKDNVCNH